ncbi:MAG: tyrosine-type recombinase/integrase [Candidatus Woesearchaeota archaeon]
MINPLELFRQSLLGNRPNTRDAYITAVGMFLREKLTEFFNFPDTSVTRCLANDVRRLYRQVCFEQDHRFLEEETTNLALPLRNPTLEEIVDQKLPAIRTEEGRIVMNLNPTSVEPYWSYCHIGKADKSLLRFIFTKYKRWLPQIFNEIWTYPSLVEIIGHFVEVHEHSPSTTNQMLAALKRFEKVLYEIGYTNDFVIARIGRRKIVRRIPKHPAPEQLDVILEADLPIEIPRSYEDRLKPRDRAMIELILSGLRRHEVVSIRMEDVDTTNWTIHVKEVKGGGSRNIHVVGVAREALTNYLAGRKYFYEEIRDPTFLFLNQHGRRLTDRGLFAISSRYFGIGTHALRRTSAEDTYRKSGSDMIAVKQLLGHNSLTSTVHYLEGLEYSRDELEAKHPRAKKRNTQ